FTYKKNVPNRFGNTGLDGTEIPLPAVFDLRGGKKIHYVLAGLPDSGPVRDRIIQATREVIADVNTAFRKALAGTPMERADDVVVMTIEGVDEDYRHLGDLDRNYIYYVQKRTQSRIIGLGGAHANPR